MLLLARLGSVAVFAALGALAVRLAPARKNVFFAAGLLPMALSLAGSVSADTLVNGLALVFTALCLRGLLCTEQLGRAEQAGLLVLAALIGPMKAVYLVLVDVYKRQALATPPCSPSSSCRCSMTFCSANP